MRNEAVKQHKAGKYAWITAGDKFTFDEILKHIVDDPNKGKYLRMSTFKQLISKCDELQRCIDDGFTLIDIRYWLYSHHSKPRHVICQGCNSAEIHASSPTAMNKTCGSKACFGKVMVETCKKTCLQKYGYEHVWSVPEIRQKADDKKIKRYGNLNNIQKQIENNRQKYSVDYTWQIPGVKEKSKQTNIERRGCEYALQSKDVRAKCKETIDKHKSENPNYYQEIHERAQRTNVLNGHDPNWNNHEQAKQTFVEHYGVDNNMKCEQGKEEYRASIRQKYGKDYFVQTEEFQLKHRQNYKQKTGYEHQAQNPEVQLKTKKRYRYHDIEFDSLPELAFYIWLSDMNKQFQYHPRICFNYEYDGQTYAYFPDFTVDDQCFEIKGDHFFNEDGTMKCPYRYPDVSDEQHAWTDGKYEAKHQCMLRNNVKILRHAEYSKYIDYVEQTYGKGYLQQFKKKPEQSKIKNHDKATDNK